MTDAMSKKEKLARGSAVIKVMRVNPRPGRFLKSYMDPHKMPKKVKIGGPKGVLADMPHLDVKNAIFNFLPSSAKIPVERYLEIINEHICGVQQEEKPEDLANMGVPEGDSLLNPFQYEEWLDSVSPAYDGNLAEHFNIMLGLLMSMAIDSDNVSFADAEAYPCVQFLRTIKTPDGVIPYNSASFICYIEYVAQKMLDEG
ncbi:uncharacterized protein LOC142319979 [Lycorma delicatula]|uniref:uncharacterized protein LOC142319979 n=1 Tax=Lycorma delicatula TaxID=130591 RepID=UPI003F51792F